MSPRWWALLGQQRRELALLALIGTLVLIPWLVGMGAGLWFMFQQGWAWTWWAGSMLLLLLALLLLRWLLRVKPPVPALPMATPGASQAEQKARAALRQRAAAVRAADLASVDALSRLVQAAFDDVARAYSPEDPVALWRFTLPELLLMTEDFARRLRDTLLRDFPVLQHIELSWAASLVALSGPTSKLLDLYRLTRWINPSSALLAELRGGLFREALGGVSEGAKAQLGAMLVEEAGETAIKLYAGAYRQRADELPPAATTALAELPEEPLTVLLAGRRNAGKSALLNALLGRVREPVGLLTPPAADCRAYLLDNEQIGALILVDCPGSDTYPDAKAAWLEQAIRSDLVLWVAAADRADRAGDQRALALLDALTERRPELRPVPRILVLTHADRLDPPLEWAPPYDIEQGNRGKEEQMRAASRAASEQLGIPPERSALIAIPPQHRAWNLEGLYQAIVRATPEARQKQLERRLAKAGWLHRAKNLLTSLPAVSNRASALVRRMLRRGLKQ